MSTLSSLTWEGNSKAMFDKMISTAPAFMRDKALKKFADWTAEKSLTTITEALIEQHVTETLPPQFRGMVLGQLASLKS